jgi:hypothetical protein
VGATEIPSEQPGTKRYERVDRVSNGYAGERSYTYDGGCITYRFKLSGRAKAEPIAAVTEALGFVSRDMVRQYVRDRFGGHLELDPP